MFNLDMESLGKSVDFIVDVNDKIESNVLKNTDIDIIPFKAINHGNTIAAIDGSNFSVQGGAFVFSAIRSGIHYYSDGQLTNAEISRVKLEVLTKDNYLDVHKEYFENVTGDLPKSKIDFDKATERIRTLLEWDKVKHLVETLSEGDIILFDGSMISGVISTNKIFFENICEIAKRRGIVLAGLSKDSTLTKKNVPIQKMLSKYVDDEDIMGNWYTYFEDEDTYFVKFRRHINSVFRLDLVLPPGTSDIEVISKIGSYCFDAGIPAYPFPLQTIHDDVRISTLQFEKCLEIFKTECLNKGLTIDFINDLFAIYHDQLDIISSGR